MPTPRAARRLLRALPVLLVAGMLGLGQLDDYSGYEGQTECRSHLQPGTRALSTWLTRTYGGGIVSGVRPCASGASEHYDGRAIDWGNDVANPSDVKRVDRLLATLFAPDAAGNQDALARRLGIMYIIWNDRMYSAYRGFDPVPYLSSGCTKVRTCSKTLRHRDHVHISLSLAGGAGQTTWYLEHGVTPAPVFYPRTRLVDPDRTTLLMTTMRAAAPPVRLPWKLKAGTAYRFVIRGRVRTSASAPASNAACMPTPDGWVAAGRGFRLGTRDPWVTEACTGSRTQELTWTPRRDGRPLVQVADTTPRNNRGRFIVMLVRPDVPTEAVPK